MTRSSLFAASLLGVTLLVGGCASKPKETGFLSSYANLEPTSSTTLRYLPAQGSMDAYPKVVISPVTTYLHDREAAAKLGDKDREHLEQHLYQALRKSMAEHFEIVDQSGPGVARLRVAITNLKKATPALNIIPQTKLTGLGLGEASAEAELLDSVTGKQLAAAIDSSQGSRFSLSGLSQWGDVEAVMDDWAKKIANRLGEARTPAQAKGR
jgi:hypothetical protein